MNRQHEAKGHPLANTATMWLVIIIHLLTIVGFIWAGAVQYGALLTRLDAQEKLTSRLVSAQESTASAMQALAMSLTATQTMVDERTSRAESRGLQHTQNKGAAK